MVQHGKAIFHYAASYFNNLPLKLIFYFHLHASLFLYEAKFNYTFSPPFLSLKWDNDDVVSEGVVGVDNIKHDLVSKFAHS